MSEQIVKLKSSNTLEQPSPAKSIKHSDSQSEKEAKSPYSPSSPFKKMFGLIGNIGNIGKGALGTLSKGLGLNYVGKMGKAIGKNLGLDLIGKHLENMGKQGIRGLGMIGKQGFKGLNNLTKVVGLNSLVGGINNLSRIGIGQLGKGLKMMNNMGLKGLNNLSKGLNLTKLQERLKMLAGINSDVLTEREKKIQTVKGHLKRSDTLAAIIAIVCSALSYYENDDFYEEIIDANQVVIKARNTSTIMGNTIRGAIIIATLALLVCIYLHYHFRLKILKLKRLRLEEDNIYSAGLVPKLMLELFICSICCPPYFDYTFKGYVLSGSYEYSYNSIINFITMVKGYLISRLYQHYSPWSNERAVRACKRAKCQAGVMFAIKAELKRRPYLMLGILMFFTIVYLGMAMRTFEISYKSNDQKMANKLDFTFLANNMWLIIITMTTVGFGEGYPSTHLGRFVGVMACIIGMLLVSLMVVSLTLSSEFTQEESKAFYILKRIYDHDNAKDKAANVIKTLLRLKNIVKTKETLATYTQRFVWLAKLKKNISIFKNDFRIATSHNLPVDEMLKNLQEKLENDINDIKEELKTIPEIEDKCKDMKEGQMKINQQLNEILKMQALIGEQILKIQDENSDIHQIENNIKQ